MQLKFRSGLTAAEKLTLAIGLMRLAKTNWYPTTENLQGGSKVEHQNHCSAL